MRKLVVALLVVMLLALSVGVVHAGMAADDPCTPSGKAYTTDERAGTGTSTTAEASGADADPSDGCDKTVPSRNP